MPSQIASTSSAMMIGLLQSGTGIGSGMWRPMPSSGLLERCARARVRAAAGRVNAAGGVPPAAGSSAVGVAGAPVNAASKDVPRAAVVRAPLVRAWRAEPLRGWGATPAIWGTSATLGAGAVAAVAERTLLAGSAVAAWAALVTGAAFPEAPAPAPPAAPAPAPPVALPDDAWCLPRAPAAAVLPWGPWPPPGRVRLEV